MSAWGAIVLGAFGLGFSLLMGMLFSLMESIILILNRIRLVELFADETPAPTTEQEIFRETKEVYFVTRLGLAGMLTLAGASLLLILCGPVLHAWRSAESGAMWIGLLWRVGVVCLVLPPVFLFVVYGVPRLLLRQEGMESDDDIPRWLRPFLGMVRSLRVLSRVFYLLPFGGLFQHHQLTKSDLLALVTDLEWEDDDEEPEAEPATEASEGLNEEEEEETDEEEIIYNILDLEETLVREVMKPINSVVAIRLGRNSAEDVKELAARTGYSRFPVYRDRIVDLVGYVSIYDILRNENPNRPLESFLTPAYFVPEFMKLNTLLAEFLRRGERVAIVVDEYGGSSGWVTREDVLEEIVGEIEDEFDTRAKGLRELENGEYLAEGAMNVDDFTEETGLTFEESRQYDTLAGFILMRLQRMPREGDRVETEEAVYEVTRMEMNRVAEIKATPKPRPL